MQTIYIDIQQRDIRQIIHAKQADSQSRFFKVILLDGGATFAVPTGANPSIWFDGAVPGWYDTITLPNGSTRSAFSISGNEITCELAEQAVASSGTVLCCLMLNTSTGYQLGAWNIAIDVEAVPAMDSPEATEYFNAFSGTVAEAIDAAERAEEAAKKIDPNAYYNKTETDELLDDVNESIGANATAIGKNTTAIGANATAIGELSLAVTAQGAIVSQNTADIRTRTTQLPSAGDIGALIGYNLLYVNMQDRYNAVNASGYVFFSNDSARDDYYWKWAGLPGTLTGGTDMLLYREVLYYNQYNVMVRMTELFPTSGRLWCRFCSYGNWGNWNVTNVTNG